MTNGGFSTTGGNAIYLGLGSNLGDREGNLREAIKRIKALGIDVTNASSIYETEPVGLADQPWFLNQVIETKLPGTAIPGFTSETSAGAQAEALLLELLDIERKMGRERSAANAPRVIDIDLLLFGDLITGQSGDDKEPASRSQAGIVVPHPRMHLRRFVLEALCEIAPGLIHPVSRKTCREILSELDDYSAVRISFTRNQDLPS